jgi:hypothetical protein
MRGTVTVVGRSPGSFTGTRPGGPPATTPARPATTTTPPPATQESSKPPASVAATAADLSGTWAVTYDVNGQSIPGTLALSQQGNRLTGTIQSSFGSSEVSNGSAGPDGFRFTTTETIQGRTIEIIVTGTANGKELHGTATSAQLGTMTFTGTKPQ